MDAITRTEKLLDGQDLEPITRKEKFIKRIYDKTQVIPEPVTREEYFLKKAGEGGGGDVTIEQLNVTQNGEYSEQGKAYSPVIVEVPQPSMSTLEVAENGNYDAPSGTGYNRVEVNVPLPQNAYLLKSLPSTPTAIATFADGAEMVMPSLTVGVEPQQDLHGYDAPWVGGAGKNKLPMTVSGIKSDNTSGTWNGNVFTHDNGVTFTIETDTDNNVTGIKANGTASGDCNFYCGTYISTGVQTSAKGCPSDGSLSTYRMFTTNIGSDVGNGVTSTPASGTECISRIIVYGGQTVSNLLFKPIIFYASETVTSFEPYSNICPISGWDEAVVTRCGKNLFDKSKAVDNKYWTANGEQNGNSYAHSDYIKVKPSTTYYSNANTTGYIYYSVFFDENKNLKFIKSITTGAFTTDNDTAFVILNTVKNLTSIDDMYLIEGSTATEYAPYNGSTYTIDLDGTRYGGTLDVVSGVLTVTDVSVVLDGTGNDYSLISNGRLNYDNASLNYFKQNGAIFEKSDRYKAFSQQASNSNFDNLVQNENSAFDFSSSSSGGFTIRIKDTRCSTLEAFKETFAEEKPKFVYKLATPLTIQLTPTAVKSLEGVNNVFADSGEILEGEYLGGVS